MNLENILRQIKPNSGDILRGTVLSLVVLFQRPPIALRFCRQWGRSTPSTTLTNTVNDIENVWVKLKALHLAHLTFDGQQALDCAIHSAVEELNLRKSLIPLAKPRISA